MFKFKSEGGGGSDTLEWYLNFRDTYDSNVIKDALLYVFVVVFLYLANINTRY